VLIMAHLPTTLFVISSPLRAEDQVERVLPSMTVFATRKSDNTFAQNSEVEWDSSADSSIKIEADGSYTAKSTTNPYSLKSLIASLGSPRVNIDISYAVNSVSMTADGRSALATLIESLSYLDSGTKIRLTPARERESATRKLTQRRIDVLSKTLARDTNVDVHVTSSKVLSDATSDTRRSDIWRIQIQRDS